MILPHTPQPHTPWPVRIIQACAGVTLMAVYWAVMVRCFVS